MVYAASNGKKCEKLVNLLNVYPALGKFIKLIIEFLIRR